MATDLKSVVAQIKSAYVLSDYIKASGVQLKPAGAGKWKGLCSFHNDSKPSFTVSDDYQNYKCWSCGATGDIFKWVTQIEHLEFMEALKKLAEDKGIQLELEKNENAVDYRAIKECLREAANFYAREYHKLPPEHPARKQVTDRGLSEKGMVYGYAPEKRTALYDHLKSKSFTDEIILQAGVATKWEDTGKFSDFWNGRLMFVITDITGKPIGFSGRILFTDRDKRGKFVNSTAGPVFDKSSALFNVQNAKDPASKEKAVYVAEGQFDVAAFIEADVPNTVASSGTAFTQQQGAILQRLVGESGRVIFAFDGDAAGISAALKVFVKVPNIHSSAWVVQFPEGQDPCDYRLEHGNEKLKELVSNPIPLVGFVLEAAKNDFDLRTELGRAQYLDHAARVLATIASNSLRNTFTRKVALDSFTDVETVRELTKKSKPLELDKELGTVETTYTVPEELEDTVSQPLMELIDTNEAYALAARFLGLAVIDRELVPHLPKNKKKLPKEFGNFIDTLAQLDPSKPIIPEAFDESDFVEYLTSANLFPHASSPSFDTKHQFAYVFKRYMETVKAAHEQEVHARIHAVLSSTENNQLDLLEEALRSEESFMRESPLVPTPVPHRDEPEAIDERDPEEQG